MSAPAAFEDLATVIKQQIEGPLEDWVMPWHRGITEPYNPISNHTYTGNNAIALINAAIVHRFVSVEWATLRAWSKKGKGVRVRKGSKAIQIHVPIFAKSKSTTKPTFPLNDNDKSIKGFRTLSVFNGDQIENYNEHHPDLFESFETKPLIEDFIKKCKARINFHNSDAYYIVEPDTIFMPYKENFVDSKHAPADHNYYATIIHELIHWTGHPRRLNRDLLSKNEHKRRALEELIAELGTALICSRFNNSIQPRTDHAAYLKSWLQGLDEELYFGNAFKQAQVAIHYLYELTGSDIHPLSNKIMTENHESQEITKDDIQKYEEEKRKTKRFAEFEIINLTNQSFARILRIETKCSKCSIKYSVTLMRYEALTICPDCHVVNHHLLEW